MASETKYIWYASYGSNLLEERFLCYIQGGRPKGAKRECCGCADKSLPLESKPILINNELYFARESSNWSNGGVAFIKNNFDKLQKTYGRMYRITDEQFIEVLQQEIDFEEELEIDLGEIEDSGSRVVKENSWYGNIIFLGMEDEYPIFTFTFQDNVQKYTKPSKEYLTTIINGLREVYKFSSDEIVAYLLCKNGVLDNYSDSELRDLYNN